MTVFTIIVDTAWLANLIREFIKLLRKAEPEHVKSTAEFDIPEDRDGDEID